jgi:hypothetical protein
MSRSANIQLNIRSEPAKTRATALARASGKSVTQVVEEAVLAYRPQPPSEEVLPEGLIRKGQFLVLNRNRGRKITLADTNRMIADARNRDLWGNYED